MSPTAPITEFSLFQQLPPEIRIKIWELLSPPTRVIGLLPPATNAPPIIVHVQTVQREVITNTHPCHYRYIVQPKRQAIFPPLHVNREARAVWLPQYFQPQRRYRASGLEIHFDTPFISYSTDVFTIFAAWPLDGIDIRPDTANDPVDCFIGLERSRIRNIALCEISGDLRPVASLFAINTFPNLETLTILALGPDVSHPHLSTIARGEDGSLASKRSREMGVIEVQLAPCEIYELSTDIVRTNHFFNDERLVHPVALSPEIRPLHRYKTYIRSWLWHEMQPNNLNKTADQIEELWWEYMEYLFDGDEDGECPLMLHGCGQQGHTRREMLEWESPFLMGYKLLYADKWLNDLKRIGVII